MSLPTGFAMTRKWATDYSVAEIPWMVATLPLEQRQIKIFGRVSDVPRLTAWMGEASYTYSGIAHPPAAMPAWLADMRRALELKLGVRFNSVLANYYRDGSDSVAWHSDDEPELGSAPTIASVSLGASRRFAIRCRGARPSPGTRWDLMLEHGDLMVMSGRSQIDYEHSIPKTARTMAPRLNLTFRWVQP